MDNVKKLLGTRIKEIRKSKNLTQEQLAEKIGIEIPSLSNIENGKNYPSPETIEKIAVGLEMQIFELYIFEHLKEPNEKIMLDEIIESLKNDLKLLKLIHKITFSLKRTK